jgi:hypothetical protein
MPANHRQHTEVPRSKRKRAGGTGAEEPQSQSEVWKRYDPFTRVTGAALRRLNKRQNIAATVEDALW